MNSTIEDARPLSAEGASRFAGTSSEASERRSGRGARPGRLRPRRRTGLVLLGALALLLVTLNLGANGLTATAGASGQGIAAVALGGSGPIPVDPAPQPPQQRQAPSVLGLLAVLAILPLALIFALIGFRKDSREPPAPASSVAMDSAGFYRHLIQNSNDAVYLLHDRKFILINEKFREMLGVDLQDVNRAEFDFLELVAPKSRRVIEERALRVESGEKLDSSYVFTARSSAGREFEVESSVAYVPYEGGVATLGSLRDISDRWILEQQLIRAGKIEAIEKLASEVAHDLSDLLTVVGGHAERLLSALPEDDPLRAKARVISDAAKRAEVLPHRIRALSRPASSVSTEIDLRAVILDMDRLLRRLVGEGIDLIIETATTPVLITADATQIEHLVMLLAVSARDAMSAGTMLSLEVLNAYPKGGDADPSGSQGRHVVLSLTESRPRGHSGGPDGRTGVNRQTDGERRTDADGLAQAFEAVRETVEQAGATGTLHEDQENGSWIRIQFPVAPAHETCPPVCSTSMTLAAAGETILLVDDEAGIRELAEEILKDEGYVVLTAVDGAQAIRVAQSHTGPIDLLATDVMMPVLGGAGLFEALAPGHEEMSALFMSGYSESEILSAGDLEQGNRLLRKPFSPDELTQAVREALTAG